MPCIVAPAETGHQVIGELYEVNVFEFDRMDLLERAGDAEGYERVELVVERFDLPSVERLRVFVYLKQDHALPASMQRLGPLEEYRREGAGRFYWMET